MTSYSLFQHLLIAFACAVAAAAALPAGPVHPAPYHPAPKHHGDPYKIPPRPFQYAYGVKDEYSGANFDKKEEQDAYGAVNGEYRVALPDGRTQIVTYHADHENGFIADVKYEGYPSHPVVAPHKGYAPKPAPYAAPHQG